MFNIYWSASGNTRAMADAIAEGARTAGAEVFLSHVATANPESVLACDVMVLGSPAMGAEVIEEGEMEPFVVALECAGLGGKRVALFGSYDWGDGQWMRDWEERMTGGGAVIAMPSAIAHNAPDDAAFAGLRDFGARIAALS